ncbi:MAG: hypothetical protein AB4368_17730 [Xenococcaceae cyanobacterium]
MQYRNLFLVLSVTVLGLTIGSCNFSQENDILPKTDSQVNTKIIDVENISNSQIDSLIDLKRANKLTETAKFLAGIEIKPTSRLNKLKYESNWLEHHRFFAHSWSKLETEHLAEVRQWTRENLAEINNTDYSIFYPFSSADLLYAYSLFPQAREYILIDSKPIGTIPDLQNNSIVKIKEELQEVRDTLYPLFEFGFSSSDMPKIELDDRGVLPILLVFIARTNSRILDLEYINLESQANVGVNKEESIPGVKISFIPKNQTEPRILYYFSAELDNRQLSNNFAISEFIGKADKLVTYLNTAAYSLYQEDFTQMKNLILTQSNYLLQDDSGMPLEAFDRDNWDLKFYGKYTQPIALFNKYYQPDLRRVYELDDDIVPLSFDIGYPTDEDRSNLMLARNKKAIDY